MASLLIAVIRPPWYIDVLRRATIFRSARPHEIVTLGIGRTFQNIRLFQNMTAIENVLVGMHSRMHASPLDAVLRLRRHVAEERTGQERALEWLRLRGPRRPPG